jgi:cystathionine beta-lyase family protein involved in aluminum resistance
MAGESKTVRRILHFRFTMPDVAPELLAMMKSTAPFFQMFGNAKVRLLRNVDDPKRFIQEIDYETPEALETNRQKIASDATVQAYLQTWRTMFPGAVEIDVFDEA